MSAPLNGQMINGTSSSWIAWGTGRSTAEAQAIGEAYNLGAVETKPWDPKMDDIILCELDHSGGTEYISSYPYITEPNHNPPNLAYRDVLARAVDFEISDDNKIKFGEVTLVNEGVDEFRRFTWNGYPVRIYTKDGLYAVAINNGIVRANRRNLEFEIVGLSKKLDEPVDTGIVALSGATVPLVLGSVYNVSPIRSDAQTLSYKASFMPVVSVNAKDNGAPVTHTTAAADGSIELNAQPVGQLTVDVEESHNTPSKIIDWIAEHYGLTVSLVDIPEHKVGLYYASQVTGKQILDDLANSLNAYWYLDQLSGIVFRQKDRPDPSTAVTITGDDVELGKMTLTHNIQPLKSITVKYRKNESPLRSIAGSIQTSSPEEASRLTEEYSQVIMSGAAEGETLTLESSVTTEADARALATQILAYRSVRLDEYEVTVFDVDVKPGDTVAVEPLGEIAVVAAFSKRPTKYRSTLTIRVPNA